MLLERATPEAKWPGTSCDFWGARPAPEGSKGAGFHSNSRTIAKILKVSHWLSVMMFHIFQQRNLGN